MTEAVNIDVYPGALLIPEINREFESKNSFQKIEDIGKRLAEVGFEADKAATFARNLLGSDRLSPVARSESDGRRPYLFTEEQPLVAGVMHQLYEAGIATDAVSRAAARSLNCWTDDDQSRVGSDTVRNPADAILQRYRHGFRDHQFELATFKNSVTGQVFHAGRVRHVPTNAATSFGKLPPEFRLRSVVTISLDKILDHITREMPVVN